MSQSLSHAIAPCLSALKAQGKTALIPYITAGDPAPSYTLEFMHALVDSGADILELGVPFSDPMADGAVIQAAHERALQHDVSLADVLDIVAAFRTKNQTTPVVLMGYLNPVEAMGYEEFSQRASVAGVDGVLTVDMPPEESAALSVALREQGLDPIYLIAPTSPQARIKSITAAASGFVYYVSLKGVTGAATLDVAAVAAKLDEIRQESDIAVAVGFGIKDGETAAKLAGVADAVIIGSAIIQHIADNVAEPDVIKEKISALTSEIRLAIDQTNDLQKTSA
ncbi:MAG: tryptophan synthase subunit alpha [Gammaproteobacteria bacterium]|nr:tryptophan synthase subunit alpha [Gammaproteobacteria bacterium]